MPPLSVRLQVAERQIRTDCERTKAMLYWTETRQWTAPSNPDFALRRSVGDTLKIALATLGMDAPQLDHCPALILRPYNPRIKDIASRYTPHAHDPDALVYREKADHQQKTTGRKPGALRTVTTKGSDIGLKAKFARLEGRTKTRPKAKIPGRPFGKGRKFDARK